MTDRPILFSGPMVRAILEGRKTQTRRLIPQTHPNFPDLCHIRTDVLSTGEPWYWGGKHDRVGASLPSFYVPGDRIWVREAWSGAHVFRNTKPSERESFVGDGVPYFREEVWYWADGSPEFWDWERPRPSIHMPRWASRITLDVTDVRVQRLQDISEADAIAEGIEKLRSRRGFYDPTKSKGVVRMGEYFDWATDAFGVLWDSLNAERAPWGSNPWVVAITFKPHLCNIDQMEPAQ